MDEPSADSMELDANTVGGTADHSRTKLQQATRDSVIDSATVVNVFDGDMFSFNNDVSNLSDTVVSAYSPTISTDRAIYYQPDRDTEIYQRNNYTPTNSPDTAIDNFQRNNYTPYNSPDRAIDLNQRNSYTPTNSPDRAIDNFQRNNYTPFNSQDRAIDIYQRNNHTPYNSPDRAIDLYQRNNYTPTNSPDRARDIYEGENYTPTNSPDSALDNYQQNYPFPHDIYSMYGFDLHIESAMEIILVIFTFVLTTRL